MELLSPAGNIEKLYYTYAYGADAAYIGLKKFSLRVKADNFYDDEYKKVIDLKKRFPDRKLHCALNISFHNSDIEAFKNNIEYFKLYPIDAFIVQDLGIVPVLQKEFPDTALHVSTQASCINYEAVKMYESLGFKRVVLGREVSLDEIKQIKDAVPDIELEAFCHGAMCIAYAGRCLMSAYLTGRSAQSGFCSHTCRWDYSVVAHDAKKLAESGFLSLEEGKRPGEYFPVYEGDDFTAVLSSRDINMIAHLADMKAAGLDSLKIEGRMKSVYYVALVTRAYRKALDALDGKISDGEAAPFIAELDNVAHRESTTGFYYSRTDADKTASGASDSPYLLAAEIGAELTDDEQNAVFTAGAETAAEFNRQLNQLCSEARSARDRDLKEHPDKVPVAALRKQGWHMYSFTPLNKTDVRQELEIITPDKAVQTAVPGTWQFIDPDTGTLRDWAFDGHPCVLYIVSGIEDGALVRTKDPGYEKGQFRGARR
ncbi:MAG: U32 family peptidase [Treponema sp.]|nr:U32 family peptidase [Treponema sp.]